MRRGVVPVIVDYGKRLYIIGENHAESAPRRDEEKSFLTAITGSDNYWTEEEFPDDQFGFGDTKEARALHAAALLIAYFEGMADHAHKLLADWTLPPASAQAPIPPETRPQPNATSPSQTLPSKPPPVQIQEQEAAFSRLLGDDIAQVVWSWNYLSVVWTETSDSVVNDLTKKAFDNVESEFSQYFTALRKATDSLVGNNAVRLDLLSKIAAKSGLDTMKFKDPHALADQLRMERSNLMGSAAMKSKRAGVWKIGYSHVTDILQGSPEVRSKLNIVSRNNFNQQLETWLAQGRKLDGSLASGLKTEAPQARKIGITKTPARTFTAETTGQKKTGQDEDD
jgi:hypothetical protein